jgi:hypothetical protein
MGAKKSIIRAPLPTPSPAQPIVCEAAGSFSFNLLIKMLMPEKMDR